MWAEPTADQLEHQSTTIKTERAVTSTAELPSVHIMLQFAFSVSSAYKTSPTQRETSQQTTSKNHANDNKTRSQVHRCYANRCTKRSSSIHRCKSRCNSEFWGTQRRIQKVWLGGEEWDLGRRDRPRCRKNFFA